jgi:hypothetical protein
MGIKLRKRKVVLYEDVERRCIYVVANIEGRPVPITTGKETFAPRASSFDCSGVGPELLPPTTRSSSTELEQAIFACAMKATKQPEKYKKVILYFVNFQLHFGIIQVKS